MTPAEQDEAQRVATALTVAIIDGDTEGAEVLLSHTSHPVLAQACVSLAARVTDCVDGCSGDLPGFRDGLAGLLRA